MLVDEGFKNFNLAENFQKRIKCAIRLLDRPEYQSNFEYVKRVRFRRIWLEL